jgi:phage terminase large subunit
MEALRISNKYKPLYTSNKRYFLVTGGRGSLKSTTVHDYICRLTYEPGHGVLFTRYTMASAKLSIIPEFEETLMRNGSRNDFYVTANKIVNLRTQSFIIFSGIKTSSGDQTANLKSLAGITTWVIEEGEDFIDEKAFDRIDDSIRSTVHQNRVIWIQNPSTREHFIYKRWIDGYSMQADCEGYKVTVSNHPDVEHIHTSYHIANRFGYLSPSFVRKAEMAREQNEEWYIHNYMGGWLEKAEGVIFENWSEGTFNESLPYVYGMDFGFSEDPSVLVKFAVDEKGRKIHAKTLMYEPGLSTAEIIQKLSELLGKHELIVADCAEPRLINDIRMQGFNIIECVKGPDSVRKGIMDIQGYKIIVDSGDYALKTELNHYIWNSKRAGVPIDKYNHAIDSMRYAYQNLKEQPVYSFA